jgi:hypothetical protein
VSVGLGIFLSALALIAAWQIGKFGVWKKAGKIAVWCAGISAFVFAAVMGYVWWDDRKGERRNQEQVEVIRSGSVDKYWGIKLGEEQNEVLYRKGEPAEKHAEDEKTKAYWEYRDGDDKSMPHHYVFWDDKGLVNSVICVNGQWSDCDDVVGISLGTTEEEVLKKLGSPYHKSLMKTA